MSRLEEMRHSRLKRRDPSPALDPHVYADLDALVRLRLEARGFGFLARQPVRSLLTGRRASRVRGRGLDFEELRGYQPGDDTRTIDWRVTARVGKPFIRVFTEERDRPVLLIVDQRISMFFGTRVNLKSVTAAEAAALATWRVFEVGDRVGAIVIGDGDTTEVRPHRSLGRVMAVLRAVVAKNHALRADSEAQPNPGMLNEALRRAVHVAGHDHLVAVISDFDGADAETRRLMTLLAAHNDVIAGLVYDPISVEVPVDSRLVVSDGSLQIELESGDMKLLGEHFRERTQRATEILRKLGIPMLALSTAEPVAPQIRRQLGAR